MLQAMFEAEVGDDVFEEDETVKKLEQKCAGIFGMEAGLFCTSGTMTNQIAIHIHARSGDEVICDQLSHIHLYEGGGIAANSSAAVQLLTGDRGRINSLQVSEVIKQDNVHYPISKLVSIENTVNKGGGAFYQLSELEKIKQICRLHNMSLHLDGARIFNALAETHESPKDYGNCFDSISVCLSKGLGAPIGSVLLGSHEFIKKARRVRKRFGGGWRQAGYLAAAGIYALNHHVDRLKEDHIRAAEIAKILSKLPEVESILPVETNIVIFRLHEKTTADQYVKKLASKGILASAFNKQDVRMVTHLDFNDAHLDELRKQLLNG